MGKGARGRMRKYRGGDLRPGALRRGNTRWNFSSPSCAPPCPDTTINHEGEQGASKWLVASFVFWCCFSNLLSLLFLDAVFHELLQETGAKSVVWTALYEPWIMERDDKLKSKLESRGIKVN